MVENYREKFSLPQYIVRRATGAIGFVLFAILASYVFSSEFSISDVSWWRWLGALALGYASSSAIDKFVPYFEKQREQMERMTAICTYAPEAISILSLPDLRYHFVNEVAKEMIERLSGETNPVGKRFREVHGETKSTMTESSLLHIAKTGTSLTTKEVRLKPQDPSRREIVCDTKAFPFRDQFGQIVGIVIYYQDVTERVRARRYAELANQEKTLFTMRAGNEILDAVQRSREMIELLKNNQVALADRQMLFESVASSFNELSKTATEVAELGRIHSGELTLEPSWYSLNDLVSEILPSVTDASEAKGLRFIAPEHLEQLPMILGDRSRTHELLSTLFHTAVRLTPRGRIELRLSVRIGANSRAIIEFRIIYTGYAQDSIALTYVQQLARIMDGSVQLERNKSGAGFVLRYIFEAEVPAQSKVLEFGPREPEADQTEDDITGRGLQVAFKPKKTGS